MTSREKTLTLRMGLSLMCLAFFAMLAYAISSGAATPFDNAVRSGIHRWASAPLTKLSKALSLLGSVVVLSILFVIAMAKFIFMRRRNSVVSLTLVMAGAVVLGNALKYAFHRARPEPFFATTPESYSFPSGHALFSACFFIAMAALLAASISDGARRAALWVCVGILVVGIGISRIYLGVHYPSDVIGGYLISAFWLCAVWAVEPFLPPATSAPCHATR